MSDLIITLLVTILAAFVGAALGSYLALYPASKQLILQAEDLKKQIIQQANSFSTAAEAEMSRAADGLNNIRVDVPEPRVQVSLSPWSAFWIFVATVTGIWLAQAYSKRKIVAALKSRSRLFSKTKKTKRTKRST